MHQGETEGSHDIAQHLTQQQQQQQQPTAKEAGEEEEDLVYRLLPPFKDADAAAAPPSGDATVSHDFGGMGAGAGFPAGSARGGSGGGGGGAVAKGRYRDMYEHLLHDFEGNKDEVGGDSAAAWALRGVREQEQDGAAQAMVLR